MVLVFIEIAFMYRAVHSRSGDHIKLDMFPFFVLRCTHFIFFFFIDSHTFPLKWIRVLAMFPCDVFHFHLDDEPCLKIVIKVKRRKKNWSQNGRRSFKLSG